MKAMFWRRLALGVVVVFSLSIGQASILILDGSDTYDVESGMSYDGAELYDTSTANILDGGLISGSVELFGNSTIRAESGSTVVGPVTANDDSNVVVEGGDFSTVAAAITLTNQASMTVSGGTVGVEGHNDYRMYLYGNSTLDVTGGSVMSQFVDTRNSIIMTIDGGFVNRTRINGGTVHVHATSDTMTYIWNYSGILNFHGGSVEVIQARTTSTTHIYGGTITDELWGRQDGVAYIYGYDFSGVEIGEDGMIMENGTLEGKYLDGTSFSIALRRSDDSVIYAIPEPGSLLLSLSAAGLLYLLRRRAVSRGSQD